LTQLVCVMISSNIPVSDAFITTLSSDPKSSAFLLDNLRDFGLEDSFDAKYLDPDHMSRSLLISQYDFENDSTDIEFLGKHLIQSKDDPGYYYFYKAKKKGYYDDEVKWAIYYNGPQPEDGSTVYSKGKITEKSENIKPDEDIEKMLKEIRLKLEMNGRKRYGSQYEGGYYDDLGF